MQPSPVTVAVTPAQLGLEQRRTFGTTDKNIEELGCLRFGFQMWPLLTVLLHGAVNIQEPQNHLAPKDAGSHDFGNWNSPLGVSQEDRERAVEVVTCSSPRMKQLENTVTAGLDAFQEPEMIEDGMGGSYVFKDKFGSKVAIIKPADEEALGPNNPKGYIGRLVGEPGWKPAVRVGEAALREVAAYLLDHNGFAKVPTSSLVRARHPVFCYNGADAATMPAKLGSLQEFVPHKCDTSEMGPCKFSTSDVHRIGLLDIRLFNTDRHAGNMLVKELPGSQYELIPIDHGFCLPEALEAPYFEWLHWPQAMSPFSEDELQYIQNLDIEADKKLLQKQLPNLRPGCIRVLEVTTELLKRCAKAGMTLHEIGNVMTRAFVGADEEPSELEKVCELARQAYQTKHAHRVAIAADVCRIFRRCHTPDTLMRQLEEYAAGMKQQGVVPASVTLASGPVDMESFEELGWDLFKRELVLLMEDSIKTGKWRVAA